jgi:hypothetical protein
MHMVPAQRPASPAPVRSAHRTAQQRLDHAIETPPAGKNKAGTMAYNAACRSLKIGMAKHAQRLRKERAGYARQRMPCAAADTIEEHKNIPTSSAAAAHLAGHNGVVAGQSAQHLLTV